ncbi:MAG: ABC transporter ATP-binding protein [Burkholderiaceae bacterium]|nr:ABC transporter ATP-binding protein [Burkholderiaceae bacterium]
MTHDYADISAEFNQQPRQIGGVVLDARNISLSFGGIKVLHDVSFHVRRGEILAIIGPNGAGKSSMLNIINGVYRPHRGEIRLHGQKARLTAASSAASLGISRTFQNIALFPGMTVLDNILMGRNTKVKSTFLEQAIYFGRARSEELNNRLIAERIIDFLEIQAIRKEAVDELPYGLKKRVEFARALVSEPDILLLDEPMAGMNLEEKQDMCRFILDTNDRFGTTIILIEHDMGVVMDISDRIVVLDYGNKIGDGTPAEVSSNQAVIDAYLGVAH